MADRTDFYFRQRVTEAELDVAFELLEKADRDLAADVGIYGIISGAEPTPHAPVPDLTVDLTAPGRAYDNLGQRIFFGTGQIVDCSVDHAGLPTEVLLAGQERWLGVFLRFERLLSDPRTDGNSQQVFFRRDESFEIVVRQGAPAAAGVAAKVPLQPDELLICDVRRSNGQTQILAADIDSSRRQAFIFAQGDAVQVVSGAWATLQPAVDTVQSALDEVDSEITEHFTGAARRHPASDVDIAPHGFVAAANVEGAIHELIDDLSAATGAQRVGADAAPGTPHALPAGNVDGQLSQLLAWLNAHLGAPTGAHNASAIAALAHSYISGTNVQAQLQEIVADLAATAAAGSGASRVGVGDAGGNLDATDVEAALAEILDAFEGDHFRGNESSAGLHRTIRQPNLGGSKSLLWDALGLGGGGGHLRVYADSSFIWFTLNAAWDGSAWVRDSTSFFSGGFRFSRSQVEFLHDDSFDPTFTTWSSTWRLPMSGTVNSGFELGGTVREVGRVGIQLTNPHDTSRTVSSGHAVTFRNRFPATPSSITFSATSSSSSFSGTPNTFSTNRDGFGVYTYQLLSAGLTTWWYGNYTAIA